MTTISAAAGTTASKGVSKSVIAATVAGNAIEFYDFISFAFFAVYISGAFFPPGDDFANLLKTLAVFWAGFVFRPLGGIVIGAYADRSGRRAAMILTIGLITIGTMGLALIPSYATIGWAAPTLLVICRVIQGFALGGEVGPASVFLVEAAPPGKRAFYGSWQLASQGMAVMASGLLGVLLSASLSKEQLADWGWRIPFVVCLVLIPVAFFLRGAMPETLEQHAHPANAPPREGLTAYSGYIALAVLTIIGGTVSTYVGNYMSTYAINTLKLPSTLSLSATFVGGAATLVFSLLSGLVADRFGRKTSVIAPRIALAVLIWPLFELLSNFPSAATLYLVAIAVSGLTALSAGSLVILPELLPKHLRATGFAIAYAIGVSLFGGSTQLVITWLLGVTGDPTSPAWYVIATSVITIVAVLALPETKHRSVD